MKLQTLDGTVHSAAWKIDRRNFRRLNGERLPVRVLTTSCGTPATGSTTSLNVTCESC